MGKEFNWRDEVPEGWVPLIEADEWLRESFDEFSNEYEPVPAFLIQDLRGGNMERLRPICALYGEPGLQLLAGLQEIDKASLDTSQIETPSGTAYAGYFFAAYQGDTPESQQAAATAAYAYIKQVNRIYRQEFNEPEPLDEDARRYPPGRLAGRWPRKCIRPGCIIWIYRRWKLVIACASGLRNCRCCRNVMI